MMPTSTRPATNALAGPAWRAFLASVLNDDRRRGTTIDGQPLQARDTRQLYRWLSERALPSIWTADCFLTSYSLHLDDFFLFAEAVGSSPWARGCPPRWHEEQWVWEDAHWHDDRATDRTLERAA